MVFYVCLKCSKVSMLVFVVVLLLFFFFVFPWLYYVGFLFSDVFSLFSSSLETKNSQSISLTWAREIPTDFSISETLPMQKVV